MLLTQSDELGLRFDCPIYCAEPTLLGYDNNVHDLFELDLIVFAVEPFVHAHAVKSAESLLRFFDDWHGDGVIRNAFHRLMVQDEAVLISTTHTRRPSSTGTPALPLVIHSVCGWNKEKTFSS